jgi:fumarate reductase flavoprotein subunit
VLLRTLEANLVRRGGTLARGTRASALVVDNGQCCGVVAQQSNREVRYIARAVVIADGGFQGNADLVKQYICERPDRLKQRGAGTGMGEGLQMALASGAAAVGMDRFYGHVLSRDAMTNDRLWPYPYLDAVATAAIVVGPSGGRFVDEGRGGVYIANAIARLADPLSSAIVFDQAIWDGAGRQGLIPANPHMPTAGGTLLRADTLEELAALLAIAPAALVGTVRQYNAAIETGTLASLAPTRSASRRAARPVCVSPFYAAPACAGICAGAARGRLAGFGPLRRRCRGRWARRRTGTGIRRRAREMRRHGFASRRGYRAHAG